MADKSAARTAKSSGAPSKPSGRAKAKAQTRQPTRTAPSEDLLASVEADAGNPVTARGKATATRPVSGKESPLPAPAVAAESEAPGPIPPMPDRFRASSDHAAGTVSLDDRETGRSAVVPMAAYGEVRRALAALFGPAAAQKAAPARASAPQAPPELAEPAAEPPPKKASGTRATKAAEAREAEAAPMPPPAPPPVAVGGKKQRQAPAAEAPQAVEKPEEPSVPAAKPAGRTAKEARAESSKAPVAAASEAVTQSPKAGRRVEQPAPAKAAQTPKGRAATVAAEASDQPRKKSTGAAHRSEEPRIEVPAEAAPAAKAAPTSPKAKGATKEPAPATADVPAAKAPDAPPAKETGKGQSKSRTKNSGGAPSVPEGFKKAIDGSGFRLEFQMDPSGQFPGYRVMVGGKQVGEIHQEGEAKWFMKLDSEPKKSTHRTLKGAELKLEVMFEAETA